MGEVALVAALTEPHPSGGLVPLGLLLMDPKELEMPSLVAQDHSLGGGNTDSGRPRETLNATSKQTHPLEKPI